MPIIGRDAPADIVVHAPQVSACHAEIRPLGGGAYLLRDLGSSNGTFVNGRRIGAATVTAADEVRLGSAPFHVASWTAFLDCTGTGQSAAAAQAATIRGRSRNWVAAIVVLTTAIAGAGLWFWFSRPEPASNRGRPAGGVARAVSSVIAPAPPRQVISDPLQRTVEESQTRTTAARLRSIATALEAYAVDHNRYPDARSISELVTALSPTYVRKLPATDGWGRDLRYARDESGYRIESSGSDGRFGSAGVGAARTGDDLVVQNGELRNAARP